MTSGVVCSNDHVANSKSFFVLQADSRFPGSWSQTTILIFSYPCCRFSCVVRGAMPLEAQNFG